MKKWGLVSLLLIFVASLCFNFLPNIKTVNAYENINESWEVFEKEYNNLIQNDDYSTTLVPNNVSKSEFVRILSEDGNISASTLSKYVNNNSNLTKAMADVQLNSSEITEICENIDYNVNVEDDGYIIYPKYQFKRLVVMGKVTNSYGAEKVLTFKDYNILAYSSQEQTKIAFEQLSNNTSLTVVPVSMVYANDYSYSSYVNEWGAQAIDYGYYKDYLVDNNVNKEVVVAVFDTGINTNHNMLKNRILKDENGNLVGYASINSTYSGYVFEDDGWTDLDEDGNVEAGDYPTGHGSHVSGIIAGITPNNVKILPVKVLGHNGRGSTDGILTAALAIYSDEVLTKYNVVCANFSLGAKYPNESSANLANAAYEACFNVMLQNNIIPVVSAGNEETDAKYNSPAGCDNAVTVGAVYGPTDYFGNPITTNQDYKGTFYFDKNYSNYGDDVDIVAPGTWILSASIGTSTGVGNDDYLWMVGTSQAAPHVSAVVALLCLDKNYYDDNVVNYNSTTILNRLYNNCVKDFDKNGKSLNNCYGLLNLKYHNGNINCEVTDNVVTYDGGYHTVNVKVTDVDDYTIMYGFDANSCNISDITTSDEFKNCVVNKKIYVKISALGCIDTIKSANLTINKVNVTISTLQKFTYGENINLDSSNYTITRGTVYGGDNLNIILSTLATRGSEVNDYEIQINSSNSNYNVTADSCICRIEARQLNVSGTLRSDYGDAIVLDLSICSITNSVDSFENLALTATTSATSNSNVGIYDVVVSTANNNYRLNQNVIYRIIEKHITITAQSQEFEYGATIDIDTTKYEISEPVKTDEIIISLTLDSDVVGKNVGTYPNAVKVHYTCSNNYTVGVYNGSIKILKCEIDVEINDADSIVYGDEVNMELFTYTIVAGVIQPTDVLNVSLTTSATSKSEVGLYYITGSANNNNYNVNFLKTGTLEILKREIEIDVQVSGIYGEVINLKNVEYVVQSGSVVNSDNLDLKLSTSATTTSNIGSYNLEIIENNDNYDITLSNTSCYIVEKRQITISSVQYSIYGDMHRIDKSNYYISKGSIVNNDNLNLDMSILISPTSNIGEYPIKITYNNDNYDVKSNAKLIVKARSLKIKILDISLEYGDAIVMNNTKFTVLEGGIVVGDDVGITLFSKANNNSGVGNYSITGKYSNKNYLVEFVNGNLNIAKRKITIKLLNQSISHGDPIRLDNTAYSVVKGEIREGDDLAIKLYSDASTYSSIGTYSIYAKSNNDNYEIIFDSGELNIKLSVFDYCFIGVASFIVLCIFISIAKIYIKKSKSKKTYNQVINRLK